jgi:hypothetical protein
LPPTAVEVCLVCAVFVWLQVLVLPAALQRALALPPPSLVELGAAGAGLLVAVDGLPVALLTAPAVGPVVADGVLTSVAVVDGTGGVPVAARALPAPRARATRSTAPSAESWRLMYVSFHYVELRTYHRATRPPG